MSQFKLIPYKGCTSLQYSTGAIAIRQILAIIPPHHRAQFGKASVR